MVTRKQEIEARFTQERFRFGDTIIGSVRICASSKESAAAAGVKSESVSVKGDADLDELQPGLTYRFYGQWSNYTNKQTKLVEKQFHFTSFVQALAHDEEGIVAYLAGVGEGCGVGPGTAKKAWERWGSDAVRVIRENPRELLAINKRLSDLELQMIGEKLVSLQKVEHATIELTNLLHGRGFAKKLPRKLIQEWGNRAAEIVRKNPYRLMQFRGCGFKLCDQLYLELGGKPTKLLRQALCGWYAVASDQTGDVWFPRAKVMAAIRSTIGAKADPDRAIEFAERLGRLSPNHFGALAVCRTNGTNGPLSEFGNREWVAEGKRAEQERRLAKLTIGAMAELQPRRLTEFATVEESITSPLELMRCARCSRELTAPEVHVWNGKPFGPTCIGYISDGTDVEVVSRDEWIEQHPQIEKFLVERATKVVVLPEFSLWPDVDQIRLVTQHQRDALSRALVGRIGILGGSPGTGKSHATAQLVKALLESGRVSIEDVAIGAPTGKAAVRITELLQAASIRLHARTWHSLLGIGQSDTGDGWSFRFSQNTPWPFKVIIGDEESMKDLSLACAVMAARAKSAHMLLVGDIFQLPPVGAGAPLRDLIAAGVPYGQLTEIHRASGGIVEACAAIRDGKRWEVGDNFHLVEAFTPAAQLVEIERIVDRARAMGLDPIWDVQVITPTNGFANLQKGQSPVSRHKINAHLQGLLNDEPRVAGTVFRRNDKIVCLKNGYISLANPRNVYGIDESLLKDGHIYVANGQLAKVIEVDEKFLIAQIEKSDIEIRIPRGKASDGDGDEEEASNGCSFDLAYALSCHKYQGSECPVVIVVADEYAGAKRLYSFEWWYTAWSRGRQHVWTIGRRGTVDAAIRRRVLPLRKTFLREQIGLIEAEKMLLEMV